MKKKLTITKFIMSLLMMLMTMTFMSSNINASEEVPSVTFILSDELIDAGYRMAGCNSDSIQCFYNGKTSIGVENKLSSNHRVSGYPAVNNGINWQTVDVEFRVNGEVVSQPVFMSDNKYHPKPIDFSKEWEDGTVFVAYFRKATVNYYDSATLLNSETLIVGNNASTYIPEKADSEDTSYTFVNWIKEDGSDADLTNIQFNTNVYAVYEETPKFLASFIADGQTLTNERIIEGGYASYQEIPTKKESLHEDDENTYRTTYTFAYWSVEGVEADPASYAINADTVFEAVFNEEVIATKKEVVNTETTPPVPVVPEYNEPETTIPESEETITTPAATPTQNLTTPQAVAAITQNANALQTSPMINQVTANEATTTPETEVIENNQTPLANPESLTTIDDEQTPLASPAETATWSLINLICMAVSIILGVYLIAKKDEQQTIVKKITIVFCFITSTLIFFLTQNFENAMGMVDNWTIVMSIILIMQIVLMFYHKKQEN